MLPLKVGESYWIHTPVWGYVAEVKEVGALHVTFARGCQVHDWGDFPAAVGTGEFSSGAELSPLGEFFLPLWMVVAGGPWPHALPLSRTHKPLE